MSFAKVGTPYAIVKDGPGTCYSAAMIRMADLARMSEEGRDRVLNEMRPDDTRIIAELHSLEYQYGISSGEMRAMFRRGEIDDTADTARWLVLMSAVGW